MTATVIKIKLCNELCMKEFYRLEPSQLETAQSLWDMGEYRTAGEFAVEGTGEEAAEEVFDLTNNPSRQDEREQLYGSGRSLSVGDIVEVDGDLWLCMSQGWAQLA